MKSLHNQFMVTSILNTNNFLYNITFFLLFLIVPAKNNRTTEHHGSGRSIQKSSSSCNISSSRHSGVINNNNSGNDSQRSQRKNVISCVTVADSDGEERRSPKAASKLLHICTHFQLKTISIFILLL